MPQKRLPTIDEIDLSSIPDKEIGKFAVEELLKGFAQFPEEERPGLLRQQKENRDELARRLNISLDHDATILAFNRGQMAIYDLPQTVNAVIDVVLSELSKVYG
jgi:hypothetical protein